MADDRIRFLRTGVYTNLNGNYPQNAQFLKGTSKKPGGWIPSESFVEENRDSETHLDVDLFPNGEIPVAFQDAVEQLNNGIPLTRSWLQSMNQKHKQSFLDGNQEEMTCGFEPVSLPKLINWMNTFHPKWQQKQSKANLDAIDRSKAAFTREQTANNKRKFVNDQSWEDVIQSFAPRYQKKSRLDYFNTIHNNPYNNPIFTNPSKTPLLPKNEHTIPFYPEFSKNNPFSKKKTLPQSEPTLNPIQPQSINQPTKKIFFVDKDDPYTIDPTDYLDDERFVEDLYTEYGEPPPKDIIAARKYIRMTRKENLERSNAKPPQKEPEKKKDEEDDELIFPEIPVPDKEFEEQVKENLKWEREIRAAQKAKSEYRAGQGFNQEQLAAFKAVGFVPNNEANNVGDVAHVAKQTNEIIQDVEEDKMRKQLEEQQKLIENMKESMEDLVRESSRNQLALKNDKLISDQLLKESQLQRDNALLQLQEESEQRIAAQKFINQQKSPVGNDDLEEEVEKSNKDAERIYNEKIQQETKRIHKKYEDERNTYLKSVESERITLDKQNEDNAKTIAEMTQKVAQQESTLQQMIREKNQREIDFQKELSDKSDQVNQFIIQEQRIKDDIETKVLQLQHDLSNTVSTVMINSLHSETKIYIENEIEKNPSYFMDFTNDKIQIIVDMMNSKIKNPTILDGFLKTIEPTITQEQKNIINYLSTKNVDFRGIIFHQVGVAYINFMKNSFIPLLQSIILNLHAGWTKLKGQELQGANDFLKQTIFKMEENNIKNQGKIEQLQIENGKKEIVMDYINFCFEIYNNPKFYNHLNFQIVQLENYLRGGKTSPLTILGLDGGTSSIVSLALLGQYNSHLQNVPTNIRQYINSDQILNQVGEYIFEQFYQGGYPTQPKSNVDLSVKRQIIGQFLNWNKSDILLRYYSFLQIKILNLSANYQQEETKTRLMLLNRQYEENKEKIQNAIVPYIKSYTPFEEVFEIDKPD